MKYCLSSRQTNEYLEKADEIRVKYKDRDIVYDFSQKYPTATFILEAPLKDTNVDIDWVEIGNYQRVTEGRFIFCLNNIKDVKECKDIGIKFYFGFPINSFYELRSLKELGVCYFRLGEPIFFQLDKVKQFGIPVRAVPNVCYDAYFPQQNGICGQWIRPEDISVYEQYIDIFEFEDADLQKERALYRIYHDDGKWPSNLNLLFTNLNYSVINRYLPDTTSVAERRTVCGQRCQAGDICNLCHIFFKYGEEHSDNS